MEGKSEALPATNIVCNVLTTQNINKTTYQQTKDFRQMFSISHPSYNCPGRGPIFHRGEPRCGYYWKSFKKIAYEISEVRTEVKIEVTTFENILVWMERITSRITETEDTVAYTLFL